MSKKQMDNSVPTVAAVGGGIMIDGQFFQCADIDAERLASELEETRGWHVSDEVMRAFASRADADEMIEVAHQDPSYMDELVDAMEIVVTSVTRQEEMKAKAANSRDLDIVKPIPAADYTEHVAIVARQKADYYLTALDVILEADGDETKMAQAMEAEFGSSYQGDILAAFDELQVAGEVERGRRLISVISEVSPELFSLLQEKYIHQSAI